MTDIAATKTATDASGVLMVPSLAIHTLQVPIVGTSPIIIHRFTEKAKQQMLDKMQGGTKVKTPRVPEDDYKAAFYNIQHPDGTIGHGFPAIGFKAATVSAARLYDKSVTMTSLRQVLFVEGVRSLADPQELIEIEGTPHMREDVVRVGMGTTDLRYRPEWPEWRAKLIVKYVASSINQQSVLSLIDAGGFAVGVGEWRPEKNGQYGQYKIDTDGEGVLELV